MKEDIFPNWEDPNNRLGGCLSFKVYAKNIVNFLSLFIKKDEKKIDIDWNDKIINAVVLTHNGILKLEEFK